MASVAIMALDAVLNAAASLEVTTSQNICLVIAPKPHWMRKSDMTRPLRPIRRPMPNIRKTAQISSTGLLLMIGLKIKRNKISQARTKLWCSTIKPTKTNK